MAANRTSQAAYRVITDENEEIPTPAPERLETGPEDDIGNSEVSPARSYFKEARGGCYGEEAQCAEECYEGDCDLDCCEPCFCPCWTVTADAIIFERTGTTSKQLAKRVERVPGSGIISLEEVLNSREFNQGSAGGPRLSLTRHCDLFDLELLYFQIDGWNDSKIVVPEGFPFGIAFSAANFSVVRFDEPFQWDYSSKLYNAEINLRFNPLCRSRITLLTGFRWAELREDLNGGVLDPSFTSFWHTKTTNDLYGFQIGAEAILLERYRFRINGLLKAGIYGNHAEQTTLGEADNDVPREGSASAVRTAFLGEVGLQCKYQVTHRLNFRAGYEAMWIDGVALAPGQVVVTNLLDNEIGVANNGGVFFHGATVGLEYSF